MKLKKGDEIVLIGTNAEGSVNGVTLKIAGISELAIGPDGKAGYMHLDDAKELLRMEEILELALRVDKLENVDIVTEKLNSLANSTFINKDGKAAIEIHPWTKLTNFTSTLTIIDVMAVFLKVILIFIVLFSIMNMMIMAVYERIGEIGTISAIGTLPGTITSMFMWEGFFLGIISSTVGSIIGIIINYGVSAMNITYKFSRNMITLKPEISLNEIITVIITITIISIIASLIPAYKASKLEPVEALRG
jgi:putative ABC transport system permease protein